ncbi:MAG: type II CRISPR-associated endonuclease Cas1 [Cyclobacteriaceae bacterium]
MLKRTLFFSNPYHLSSKQEQMIIKNANSGEHTQVPIEDLGFVVLDHYGISLTQHLAYKLSEHNVALIFCNDLHLPTAMVLNLEGNQTQNEKFRAQVAAGKPLLKQLWQQTVTAKINNQANALKVVHDGVEDGDYPVWIPLEQMAKDVKSGDSTFREAKAAKYYWGQLFGTNFRRERFGAPPNPFLNYGYAIIRAAIARALVGSGLLPTLGIHHHNKYNAYCLADDIMEPYRPYVDVLTWQLVHHYVDFHELDKERKAKYLELLGADVWINDKKRPMMVAMSETTASLVACFEGKRKQVKYPILQ